MTRDVNGPLKCKNYIGLKYEMLFVDQTFKANTSEQSECNETVYCVCRRPFDPHQESPRFRMFQCEGPCRKWVHPYCFGETYEQILEYERKDTSYFCTFCKPEEAGK